MDSFRLMAKTTVAPFSARLRAVSTNPGGNIWGLTNVEVIQPAIG